MRPLRWMRRFDFDTEAVVRLAWRGVTPLNIAAPVKYLTAAQGGVSHFRYGRDNVLLTWMHARLLVGFVKRDDDSLGLKLVDLRLLILTCSVDATTERWGVGIFIGGRGQDLDGRMLDVTENDGMFALTMQAKVKATTIDGTLLRFSHHACCLPKARRKASHDCQCFGARN